MKISYNWLQTYFDKPLPKPEELQELFSLRAFDVESLDKLGTGDSVLDIKVLPDRACYALSHKGIADELHAIKGLSLKKKGELKEIPLGTQRKPTLIIEDHKLARRHVSRIIEGVTVAESPTWLQERLTAIGQRSINNIVDATNFVMMDMGQPLHAFDADKIKGAVVIRAARMGETVVTLDGKNVSLEPTTIILADDTAALDIAGIKGGKKAELNAQTTSILLSSANFDPVSIRRASFKTGVKTDAAKRFENNPSPELATEGMEAVTRLILELCPKAKAGEVVDVYPDKVQPKTLSISAKFIAGVLGTSISKEEIVDILERLSVKVEAQGDVLSLTIPTLRRDLVIPEDIVEEVGRIYGYERVTGVVAPPPKTPPKLSKEFYYTEKIKNILVEKGFSEVSLYTMVAKGDIEIAKPLASDKAFLRTNLSFGMERSVKMNTLSAPFLGLDEIKEFEIGKVFTDSGEFLSLAIGVSLIKKVKGKTSEGSVKEVFEALGAGLGLSLKPIITNFQPLAVGEVILENLFETLSEPRPYADLHFSEPADVKYKKFSLYPFIVRDVALFVSADTKAESVVQLIKENAGELVVRGPELFDEFSKDGKKSLAFRLIFQSFDRTLSDEEVNSVMEKVYIALKGKSWEVR